MANEVAVPQATSTFTEHPICNCGQQMTRFVRINTLLRAVEIKDSCDTCGYYKLDPWSVVDETKAQ